MTKINGISYQQLDEYFDKKMVTYLAPEFKEIKDKLNGIQSQLNNQKLLAAVIGGFSGVVVSIIALFRPK